MPNQNVPIAQYNDNNLLRFLNYYLYYNILNQNHKQKNLSLVV